MTQFPKRLFILPSQSLVQKKLLWCFLASFILNGSFFQFFKEFHDSSLALGSLLLVNSVLAIILMHVQLQSFLTFYRGRWKGMLRYLFAYFACFLAYLFPVYGFYLFYLGVRRERSDKLGAQGVFIKPFLATLMVLTLSLLGGPPAKNSLAKTQLGADLSYVAQVAYESYHVFLLKDRWEEECVRSDDPQCYTKKISQKVLPGTNTAVILGLASDALIIFKRKKRLESELTLNKEDEGFKKAKGKISVHTAKDLLENNYTFMKYNRCERVRVLDLVGSLPLVSGPFTAYMLQMVDSKISAKFDRTASERLGDLSRDLLREKKAALLEPEHGRKIASIQEFLKKAPAPSQSCSD